jgi:type II secretory pathway pseudopilin PulG
MKKNYLKFAVMALMSVFMLASVPQNSFAAKETKTEKQLRQAREKQFKVRKKQLNKDGWTISGSAKTIDVALLEYYQKLNSNENNYEIVGEVSACNSINVCKQAALNNAVNEYASRAGSAVKGRIASDFNLNQSTGEGEFDKLYGAYERLVQAEIKDILQQSFSVVREKSDGGREFKTFFIIDEATASKARIRAMENAARETELAQKYAEKITEFVREGFEEQ